MNTPFHQWKFEQMVGGFDAETTKKGGMFYLSKQ